MGWATLSAAANRVATARLGSVSVQAGTIEGRGFKMQKSRFSFDEEYTKVDVFLTVLTQEFGHLTYKSPVVVDGEHFLVEYQPQRFDDGTWCEVFLVGPVLNPIQATIVPWLTTMGDPITTVMGDPIDLIRVG